MEGQGLLSNIWQVVQYLFLYVEQTFLMSLKHISQKRRNGRQFLKDGFMTQFFLLA
jgi:hypothetical protein